MNINVEPYMKSNVDHQRMDSKIEYANLHKSVFLLLLLLLLLLIVKTGDNLAPGRIKLPSHRDSIVKYSTIIFGIISS